MHSDPRVGEWRLFSAPAAVPELRPRCIKMLEKMDHDHADSSGGWMRVIYPSGHATSASMAWLRANTEVVALEEVARLEVELFSNLL